MVYASNLDPHTSKSAFVEVGGSNLELNIRLKGYVYRQHLYTVGEGNGSTTTLPVEVFTQRNFVADFVRLNLNFIHKNDKFGLGELGVMYALHL